MLNGFNSGTNTMNYGMNSLDNPSAFMSWDNWHIPQSMSELHRYLAYVYLTDANINPIIENSAAYIVTEVEIEADASVSDKDKETWKRILEAMDIRSFLISFNIDKRLYGKAAAGLYVPFDRLFTCKVCGTQQIQINKRSLNWKWDKFQFRVDCPKCKDFKEADTEDIYRVRDFKNYKPVRWNIFEYKTTRNSVSGKIRVELSIPSDIQSYILKGDKREIAEIPQVFIKQMQIAQKGGIKRVDLEDDDVFVSMRPIASMPNPQLNNDGMPQPIASLRSIIFKTSMIRAQSALLREHIIPFRVVYPVNTTGDIGAANKAIWKKEFMNSYNEYLRNPTTIMTAPGPTEVTQIGGQGKILSLWAEMDNIDHTITKGMNVPREFNEGGLTWSGSSISLRMLENQFLNDSEDNNKLLNWLIHKIHLLTRLPRVTGKMKRFKMADDIQYQNLITGQFDKGVVSHEFMGDVLNYDGAKQLEKRIKEDAEKLKKTTIAQAEAQALASKTLNSLNLLSPLNGLTQPLPIPPQATAQMDKQLNSMPVEQSRGVLQNLAQSNPLLGQMLQKQQLTNPNEIARYLENLNQLGPDMYNMVMQDLQSSQTPLFNTINKYRQAVDMRAQPEQKPPRRTNKAI